MNRLLIGVLSALITTCSTPFAIAQDTHDKVAAGRHLALMVCSVCHVVSPDDVGSEYQRMIFTVVVYA